MTFNRNNIHPEEFTKQDDLLLTEECPVCGGLGEVLNQKVRAMGYTLAEGETIDEVLVPCPLCERVKAQLAKALPIIEERERERIAKWAVIMDKALYWKVMAILKGVQMGQQRDKNITWRTTLDAVIEELKALKGVPDG